MSVSTVVRMSQLSISILVDEQTQVDEHTQMEKHTQVAKPLSNPQDLEGGVFSALICYVVYIYYTGVVVWPRGEVYNIHQIELY